MDTALSTDDLPPPKGVDAVPVEADVVAVVFAADVLAADELAFGPAVIVTGKDVI